ncbi:LysE family translocator [Anaerorudis cellulosivorans]|uniref:LysE family translocator n=1 Tax=Anaerorudis cellulosivorans TaxID=3397862 RepID=UPI00221E504B|nr:LysE family translocator [Seramator thermalis]MCW1735331.1 LysE family translocator [Seramator thermalis]
MSLGEIIVKGFVIGLFVASPMGPINMLCIQRTLNRGWKHGFATGMGAMLSDLTYAIITLIGMGMASDFLSKNETTIQLVGSIVLLLFGFGVFRSNPLKGWTPRLKMEETRYMKDFISSFLLTFSNVAIILVFITLYARFQFNPLAEGAFSIIAGIVSIAVGALSWWIFITLFVSRLRKYFNRKGLIMLNRIVGSILMIFGLGGIGTTIF